MESLSTGNSEFQSVTDSSRRFKGIFFDAGNTLLRVYPSIGQIYSDAAREFGAEVPPDKLETAFTNLWNHTGPLVTNQGQRLSYERERDWWKYIVREVFKELNEFSDFDGFFDHLYYRFEQSDSWRLYDDVIAVLEHLRRSGFRLAMISNWDSRLPALCDQLGISQFFDAMVVSSIVGYEKPHPAIFRIALDRTSLAPGDVLYIGDDPYLDYDGAQKAGLHALHLDRTGRYPHHADKISDLHGILTRLTER